MPPMSNKLVAESRQYSMCPHVDLSHTAMYMCVACVPMYMHACVYIHTHVGVWAYHPIVLLLTQVHTSGTRLFSDRKLIIIDLFSH